MSPSTSPAISFTTSGVIRESGYCERIDSNLADNSTSIGSGLDGSVAGFGSSANVTATIGSPAATAATDFANPRREIDIWQAHSGEIHPATIADYFNAANSTTCGVAHDGALLEFSQIEH